jgi:hypothetical protein
VNILQEKVEAQGGLKKATREYLNSRLSNAFGFDFYETARDSFESHI